MSELLIRNVGAIATGDVRHPLIADSRDVYVSDGMISGPRPSIEAVIDAGGMLLAPGLWDAHHNPYFGDHTPHFDARGYLERTVRAGTTTIVSVGTTDLPGRPLDAQGAKQLAILAQRSWRHDRPLELKVLADTLVAAPGLGERDFAELAGLGVGRLSFIDPLPAARQARQYAEWARAQGMVVMAHCGLALAADASPLDALRAIEPDVALAANGTLVAPTEEVVDWLVERSGCALDLVVAGNLQVARRIVAAVAARDELERIVVGTGTPSPLGVLPGGVQRMVQHLVGAATALTPAAALACASGNTARAYRVTGGAVAAGEPADLILCRPPRGAAYRDALEALDRGGWLEIDMVLVDGQVQVLGEARLERRSTVPAGAT